jgi:hypothetical protein
MKEGLVGERDPTGDLLIKCEVMVMEGVMIG